MKIETLHNLQSHAKNKYGRHAQTTITELQAPDTYNVPG